MGSNPGFRQEVGCPLLQVCTCREQISLLIILCKIVYVTNKAHQSLICIIVVCICIICNGFTGYNGNVLGLIQTGLCWEFFAFSGWLVKTTLIMEDQTCRNK